MTTESIKSASQEAVNSLNQLVSKVFKTRGGRIGSGMGLLLEGLWGYQMNAVLSQRRAPLEIAWLGEHQYNDFAVVKRDEAWDPATKSGEVLRIEAKSMISAADESKAHFDALQKEIGASDLLLILVWNWVPVDQFRFSPKVTHSFLDSALTLAKFRDALHVARGGSFVQSGACPDGCADNCIHVGEPLNTAGRRERGSGPTKSRVSQNVSFAANFGGLTRMIGTSSKSAKQHRIQLCNNNPIAEKYVDFIDNAVGRGSVRCR